MVNRSEAKQRPETRAGPSPVALLHVLPLGPSGGPGWARHRAQAGLRWRGGSCTGSAAPSPGTCLINCPLWPAPSQASQARTMEGPRPSSSIKPPRPRQLRSSELSGTGNECQPPAVRPKEDWGGNEPTSPGQSNSDLSPGSPPKFLPLGATGHSRSQPWAPHGLPVVWTATGSARGEPPVSGVDPLTKRSVPGKSPGVATCAGSGSAPRGRGGPREHASCPPA